MRWGRSIWTEKKHQTPDRRKLVRRTVDPPAINFVENEERIKENQWVFDKENLLKFYYALYEYAVLFKFKDDDFFNYIKSNYLNKVYRQLALKYFPDKNPQEEEKCQEIFVYVHTLHEKVCETFKSVLLENDHDAITILMEEHHMSYLTKNTSYERILAKFRDELVIQDEKIEALKRNQKKFKERSKQQEERMERLEVAFASWSSKTNRDKHSPQANLEKTNSDEVHSQRNGIH